YWSSGAGVRRTVIACVGLPHEHGGVADLTIALIEALAQHFVLLVEITGQLVNGVKELTVHFLLLGDIASENLADAPLDQELCLCLAAIPKRVHASVVIDAGMEFVV